MIAQELCLENEPGAGAAYMNVFDNLPATVRQRLRESSINICVACLMNAARALAHTYDPSPQYYCEIISHFEKGTIHDLRERIQNPRREGYGPIIPDVYGNPNRTASNFYDPFNGEPRRYSYDLERSAYERMAWWGVRPEYTNGAEYDVRSEAEERLRRLLLQIESDFKLTTIIPKDKLT